MTDAVTMNVRWAFAGIFAFLALSTALVRIVGRGRRDDAARELWLRVRSWWVIVALFAVAVLGGRVASLVFFAFVGFLALKEYLTLIPMRRSDRTLLFWLYLAIPVQFYWIAIEWYGMFVLFIPVYLLLFTAAYTALAVSPSGFIRAVGTLHWGLMITVFSLSHAAYLLVLPGEGAPAYAGAALVLFLVLLTEANDVFQYAWGKSLGRRKVTPRVSPGKTWGGLIGGVATTVVLSLAIARIFTPMGWVGALCAGAIIAVVGFLGDITISAVKRDLRIKDSGRYIPGHGGVLDRVDSLTFTAPVFFHFFRYFYGG